MFIAQTKHFVPTVSAIDKNTGPQTPCCMNKKKKKKKRRTRLSLKRAEESKFMQNNLPCL
jgi:hypothetical protein